MNLLSAAFCIILFSLTVPFTRMAALETTPEAIILFRLIGASLICILFAIVDGWVPPRKSWGGILRTAIGSVIGFSSLTAFAMKKVPAGHAAVALAAMPMATAIYAVLRDKAHPGKKFWAFALLGTFLSFGFFFTLNMSHVVAEDFLLLLAVGFAAFGYVEGGRMSRTYGGQRIMTWAILATLPLTIPVSIYYVMQTGTSIFHMSTGSWFSIAYLAIVSQSTGMFLWFKVLAIGPMEKIALVQLLQPFFTLLASIIFLDEVVLGSTWFIAFFVAICIFGANKERSR